jgi:hypothetical protein
MAWKAGSTHNGEFICAFRLCRYHAYAKKINFCRHYETCKRRECFTSHGRPRKIKVISKPSSNKRVMPLVSKAGKRKTS